MNENQNEGETQMPKSESKQPGSLTFDSPDGPVVVVRVVDDHAWRNFDAATMEPLALNPLPFVHSIIDSAEAFIKYAEI